ncbi:hypothetical protein [Thermococcus sp. 21S9]|uniref:hypothetical protein n=1 Tax=Thermococcus sp. 21S9 TaxID=1638223 RepID=UPI001439B6A0|nr:hypothetical protein [Thermococcus sp. 21S9]NJE55340.1 hypothetical protein [Thermococcus sp. 21S9]
MRKAVAVAVVILIVLGAVAGTVYVGYSQEPGREVAPRNDGDSPDPESALIKFLERPSDGLLKFQDGAEGEYELPQLPNAHDIIVSRAPPNNPDPDGAICQRKNQACRLWGTKTALLGLPVGLPSGPRFLGVVS